MSTFIMPWHFMIRSWWTNSLWCNQTLARQFWATKVCICGQVKFLKYVLLPNWASNFLKSKFWKLFYIFFDKTVSILFNIIQRKQYFFSFPAHITAVCSFLSKSFHIMLEFHVSSSGVNNKCIRAKGQHWIWLIYALHNFVLCNNLHVFRSNYDCNWKFHKFHRSLVLPLKCWNYTNTFFLHE